MSDERLEHAKFDEDLLRLVGEGFAAEAEFPIVVTARHPWGAGCSLDTHTTRLTKRCG